MKKIITSLVVLFFLIGAGTKCYGQAAGDYVFTQATDTLWATPANWSTSDGAGTLTVATRTPSATDNVWIPATKRMGTVGAKTSASGVILTSGSSTVTLAAASTSITVGMAVKVTSITVSGASVNTIIGLTPGAYVTAINGTSITLSQPALFTTSTAALDFYPASKNLIVNGFFRVSSQFVAFGDITVNAGGLLTQGSDLYCANINNYGTINANTNYRSAKSLYFGFNGAVPGTGDYTIINDGVFGDSKINLPAGAGSGIKLLYSNQANNITIKPSTPTVSGYAFNIAQILPHANIKTTANTNLNIKETMSLLLHNGIGLSIQNNDTCTGTTRTCTIDPGVSVYVGYRFHANGGITTNDQGNFVYNVYGTLDLGTYGSAGNNIPLTGISDFGLCMTTVAGNTGTLTFNLGDGTQANAGTLILGSNVKLMKQSTQTIAINFKDYSTVQVTGNYGQAMNYQLLNNNTPAIYLFPKKFYNLTLNGAGVVLPFVAAIKGTKTYTTTYATPVAPATTPVVNWVAATSATQGSILFTGSGYYYVPVVRAISSYKAGDNPISLVGDTILQYIKPALTINGPGISNFTVNSLTGNSLTMSAAVATMNPPVPVSNVIVSFTGGKSDANTANTPTGTSTNTFIPVQDGTQYLIYLGGTDFPTASTVLTTAVNSPDATNNAIVYSSDRNKLVISNATEGDIASVYTISGIKVASAKLTSDKTTLSIASGIYLVKINSSVSKVIVR